jgi:hypothetical protein
MGLSGLFMGLVVLLQVGRVCRTGLWLATIATGRKNPAPQAGSTGRNVEREGV